jgi:hypothetical protein
MLSSSAPTKHTFWHRFSRTSRCGEAMGANNLTLRSSPQKLRKRSFFILPVAGPWVWSETTTHGRAVRRQTMRMPDGFRNIIARGRDSHEALHMWVYQNLKYQATMLIEVLGERQTKKVSKYASGWAPTCTAASVKYEGILGCIWCLRVTLPLCSDYLDLLPGVNHVALLWRSLKTGGEAKCS